MESRRRYSKAPITEAIIEVCVDQRPSATLEILKEVGIRNRDLYPTIRNRLMASGLIRLGQEVTTAASQRQLGFLFVSADGKQVFQSLFQGFVLSRLAPYEGWEPFQAEARRLWNCYRELVQPQRIVRLGVRYVNRLDLPAPVELKDYLRTVPEVSAELPQMLSGFFMRLQIPLEDKKSTLIVNQTIIEPASPNVVSLVLDLDLHRLVDRSVEDNEVWELLEELRESKNRAFEACITNQTRELIQ